MARQKQAEKEQLRIKRENYIKQTSIKLSQHNAKYKNRPQAIAPMKPLVPFY